MLAQEHHGPLEGEAVASDGQFTFHIRGAFVRYKPELNSLFVSGLVAHDIGPYFQLDPKAWPTFIRASNCDPAGQKLPANEIQSF